MKPLDSDLTHNTTRWTRNMFDDNTREQTNALTGTIARRATDPAWSTFSREVFGRLYGIGCEAKAEVATENEWASKAHALCDELPEWRAMKADAYADDVMSGIAASAVCDVINARLPLGKLGDAEGEKETLEQLREMQAEATTKADKKRLATAVRNQERTVDSQAKQAEQASEKMEEMSADIRSALRTALTDAKKVAEQMRDGMTGLGAGTGCGSEERRRIANRIALSPSLARMLALAGRMRLSARKRQASKKSNSPQEIVSIETGGDLARFVPSELAMIAGKRTRTLAFARMLERNSIQYSLEGKDPQERGPIVVCVDESGSMNGARNECAKAVMLAMFEVAIKQKRALGIVHFDGAQRASVVYDPREGAPSPMSLLDHAASFMGGGTMIAEAIEAGVELMKTKSLKRASVVLLTDAESSGEMSAALYMMKNCGVDYHVVDFAPSSYGSAPKAELRAGAETWTGFESHDMKAETGFESHDMKADPKKFENLFSM